ncbi:RNase P modulator RnpM [Floccifex sp.]|uniref:RNase P modulator RnpM n=1 Tax=Floccifex sp. TaxID=2815810 RepID=UPI003F0E2B74
MRKIPMRKCVVTQERYPKKELIRVVRTPEQEVVVDTTGKRNGHGAYLKLNKQTVILAQKNHALDRALECEIPASIYEQLMELCSE